jgi:hypothetical protein
MLAAAVVSLGFASPHALAHLYRAAGSRFEISFSSGAHATPITGRAYVAFSRSSDARRTPIDQAGETGVPLFAVNIDYLAPG